MLDVYNKLLPDELKAKIEALECFDEHVASSSD